MAARTDVPAPPGARASARFVRTSASKARRVVNLVRGLPAKEALTVLKFAPQAAAVPVYKVIASAMANAENNEHLDPDSLLVSEIHVDEGPTMRRYRPRAQGRAYRIRKRTCHITVTLEAVTPAAPRRPARKAAATATAPATGGSAAPETAAEATESAAAEADSDTTATKAPAKKAAAKKAAAKATAAEAPAKKAPAKKAAAKKATKAAESEAEAPAKKTTAKKAAKKAPASDATPAEEATE